MQGVKVGFLEGDVVVGGLAGAVKVGLLQEALIFLLFMAGLAILQAMKDGMKGMKDGIKDTILEALKDMKAAAWKIEDRCDKRSNKLTIIEERLDGLVYNFKDASRHVSQVLMEWRSDLGPEVATRWVEQICRKWVQARKLLGVEASLVAWRQLVQDAVDFVEWEIQKQEKLATKKIEALKNKEEKNQEEIQEKLEKAQEQKVEAEIWRSNLQVLGKIPIFKGISKEEKRLLQDKGKASLQTLWDVVKGSSCTDPVPAGQPLGSIPEEK